MKRIHNIFKSFKLSFSYGSVFSINSVIIVLELVIVLVMGNVLFNVIREDNASKLELKIFVENNIVMYDIGKERQVEYCTKNGQLLGTVASFNLEKQKGENFVVYYSKRCSKEYLNAINLPLHKGKWFNENITIDNNKYDFVAVVPYQYRNELKVGKVYNLEASRWLLDERDVDVLIIGILEPYLGNELICYDVKNIISEEIVKNEPFRYCKLNYFDVNELSSLGIVRFDEDYQRILETKSSERGFIIILIITLYTIFLCGFVGDRILNIDTYTKTYGTMFMCGATKRKAMVIQFVQSTSTILVSSIASFLILKYLYIVQFDNMFFHVSAFVGFILITLGIDFLISLLILPIISKKSPVSIISGRYN